MVTTTTTNNELPAGWTLEQCMFLSAISEIEHHDGEVIEHVHAGDKYKLRAYFSVLEEAEKAMQECIGYDFKQVSLFYDEESWGHILVMEYTGIKD